MKCGGQKDFSFPSFFERNKYFDSARRHEIDSKDISKCLIKNTFKQNKIKYKTIFHNINVFTLFLITYKF